MASSEEVDRLCICIVSFLAQLNKRHAVTLDEFITVRREFLEVDSFQILRTAHKVFDLLATHQLTDLIHLDTGEQLDYTPGLICLAKVFEREVNLSVVHWARRELGIDLPRFFNRPQPGVKATVVPKLPGGREINLNMERHGKWLPPGIGQSALACHELSRARLPDNWDRDTWGLLFRLWERVRDKRNEAAHTEMIDEASLWSIKDALQELSTNGLFEKFYVMKQQYRGAT